MRWPDRSAFRDSANYGLACLSELAGPAIQVATMLRGGAKSIPPQDWRRAILWGAGQLTMKLLALPSLSRIQVQAIVDSNPTLRGKTLGGAPVIGPQQIPGTAESSAIVIATLLHAEEIMAQIRSMGLRNPVLSLLPKSNGEVNRS